MSKPILTYLLPAILCLSALILPFDGLGTHNRAGEITFKRVGEPEDYEYEITLTTYTDSRSVQAHRDEVDLFFGYGVPEKSQTIRVLANMEQLDGGPNTWINVYRTRHKFPGPGACYLINFTDPNRISAIVNINDTNSVNIPFYIETELCIDDNLGETSNDSPVLLQSPISYGCLDERYEHNPNAFDPNGDSLSYELVFPKMARDRPVSNYKDPDDVNGNQPGTFSLNPVTGELVWDSPKRVGIYNIAIRIVEWRRVLGQGGGSFRKKMGYVVRDMQIIITRCNNSPPVIAPIDDICVVAGDNTVLVIPVIAVDLDENNMVQLSASGGPFVLETSPAQPFIKQTGLEIVEGELRWTINCEHIREQPYGIVFEAIDDGNGTRGKELSDLEHVYVTVIGPEPENLEVTPLGRGMVLNWQKPKCGGIIKYFIYRKQNVSGWDPGECETGVPLKTDQDPNNGFTRVGIADGDALTFYDNRKGAGLFHGVSYCYRITALYQVEGQFQQSEGIASNEVCDELKEDVPFLTHASVLNTSATDGEVELKWCPPGELDTLEFKPYYLFTLQESDDLLGTNLKDVFTDRFESYYELSLFLGTTIKKLNTLENAYSYQIDFFSYNEITEFEDTVGAAKSASTPWLKIKPSSNQLELTIETDVPWRNDTFIFYRQNRSTLVFDSIGWSNAPIFVDTGLTNGASYCYKAVTYGRLPTKPEKGTFINQSQERCGIPRDTIPPCPPILKGEALCDEFQNRLNWSFESNICSYDVINYRIYYQDLGKGPFELVDSVEGSNRLEEFFDKRLSLQKSLAGCYMVTAVDSFFNESDSSNKICLDNCPVYTLPNIFTPNGDSFNQLFIPLPDYRFIESVDVKIFNRWGQPVYQTNEVNINWDGTNQENGIEMAPGVYYYVVEVEYIRLFENQKRTLNGTIQLTR